MIPLWFHCCLWGFWLIFVLLCFSGWHTYLASRRKLLCAYSILTCSWAMTKREQKSMFLYINKDMGLRNNGIQINLWLRNLKLCFFLLLSRQRIENFQRALFSKKRLWPKSNNSSYFQQSYLVFEMLLSTFVGIVQWSSFSEPCSAYGLMRS